MSMHGSTDFAAYLETPEGEKFRKSIAHQQGEHEYPSRFVTSDSQEVEGVINSSDNHVSSHLYIG